MKQTCQKLSALLLALALCLSLCVPALAADEKTALKDAAQQAAAGALTYGGAASVSWAVWDRGALTSGALKAPEETGGQPQEAPADALYGVGSVSKIYTTAAVLRLVQEKKLDLDKPVTAYLPKFKMADERYKQITVRMLLNHSSGLMGSSMGSGLLFGDGSTEAADRLLERLAGQRLKADPGAYSVYCNDGFTLAELVVEAVAKQDFMDFVTDRLLKPAGLKDTLSPAQVLARDKERAPIYQAGVVEDPLPADCLGVVGAGGIYATAEDLASFGGALTGTKLLKQASLEAMAQPEYRRGLWPKEEAPDALAYGLGWDNVEWFPFHQNGIPALVKGGDTQYYHAGLVVLPEYQLAAAVLTSGGVSTYNELAANRMLIAALKARGVKVDETAPALPEAAPAKMPKELMKHAGYYGSLIQYKIDVTADGTLTMHYLGLEAPEQTFTYHSDGSFRDETGTALLKFVEEANGKTYLYQRAFSELPGLGGLGTSNYAAVKLPENKISEKTQKAWDTALNSDILPMNERYSSQVYLALAVAGQAAAAAEESEETETGEAAAPGYAGALRLESPVQGRYALQIPGTMGRDGYDLELRRDGKSGVLWMYQSNGGVYMEESAATELKVKNGRSWCGINTKGYAQWFRLGKETAGKTMEVTMPEEAGYWVYDGKWNVVASSVLGSGNSVEMPEDGLVVFAGEPEARFEMKFS